MFWCLHSSPLYEPSAVLTRTHAFRSTRKRIVIHNEPSCHFEEAILRSA